MAGKLELKGDKYKDLSDITDILGTRVVCFFEDDVEHIADFLMLSVGNRDRAQRGAESLLCSGTAIGGVDR